MNNIKLGVVIVTYNPDFNDRLGEKIEIYKSVADLVVVVDNNSTNPIALCPDEKLTIIANKENLGHAKGLNIGCMYLLSKGFTHAILFGQDSIITAESILRLKQVASTDKYAMIGPQIANQDNIPSTYLMKTKRWFKKGSVKENEIKEVYINITSGSTLNLKIWQEVGGFWDDLFIEKVDDEYALRLRRFGYKTMVVGDAYLTEPYGNSKTIKKFGYTWHPTFHNAWRLKLLYRNKVYLRREYFSTEFPFVVFQELALLKRIITIVLVEDNKKEKIKNILSGKVAAYRHRIKRPDGPYLCDPFEYIKQGKRI